MRFFQQVINMVDTTKFFHISTLQRRRRNEITTLQDSGGNWICEPSYVQSHILDYYQNLFTTSSSSSTNSHLPYPHNSLLQADHSTLLLPLQDNEIIDAINSFRPLTAPGLDGLHPYFYQKYWTDIKHLVTSFCHQIFREQKILHETNTMYICLILKNKNATSIT